MKYLAIICLLSLAACQSGSNKKADAFNDSASTTPPDTIKTVSQTLDLPAPFATESVTNMSKVIGWGDKKPVAPDGFMVSVYADSLDNPRWIYQAPNGDIFIAESGDPTGAHGKKSADRITLLKDADKDGIPKIRSIYLKNLHSPFGMLVLGNNFYVANTDGIIEYPYNPTATSITAKGKKILSLPGGPRHWTRNIIANAEGSKIYVAVGSGTDHGEKGLGNEKRRANIIEINPDGSGERIFASGIRNPVGMAWAPGTNTLWTAVNERDELGDDLVPDYLTSVTENGFYGWPFFYYGMHKDPRVKDAWKDSATGKVLVPDVPLGNHTASLGLAFYDKTQFPAKYRNGAFIGQHGSWNRSKLAGYKVAFVPFSQGKPAGKPEDFLTGFIADASASQVYGRPVGVIILQDGTLLVADDASNRIWRVKFNLLLTAKTSK